MKRAFALAAVLCLAACQHAESGIEVRTVEKVVEVQKPCPATPPERPAPLGPLPGNLTAALAQTLATLAEWSAPGKFGDQAEVYFATCPPASE